MDDDPIDWHIMMQGRTRQIQVLHLIDVVQAQVVSMIRPIAIHLGHEYDWVIDHFDKHRPGSRERLEAFRDETIENNVAVFPATLYSALFVSAYHFMEHDLHDLCRVVQRERGLDNYSTWASKDRGIHRAKSYLRRVAGIEFPSGGDDWQRIVNYSRLRNLVAHNGAVLDGSPKAVEVESFVRSQPNLGVTDSDEVVFTRDFASEAADNLREFWLELSFVFNPPEED